MTLSKIAAAACFVACLGATATAEEFRYNNFAPPKAETNRLNLKTFFDEVEEKTNGEIKFNNITGGSLFGAKETLDGIKDGAIAGGLVVPAFATSTLPTISLIPDMQAFASNPLQAAGAAAETILLDCPECVAESAAANAIFFSGMVYPAQHLQCTTEIESAEDIVGLKVRATSGTVSRWVTKMGAVPVNLTPSDLVSALQLKQLDCNLGLSTWLRTYSLKDVVRTIVEQPMGIYHGMGVIVLNKSFWADRTDEQKQIMLRAMANSIAYATHVAYYEEEKSAVDEALETGRVKEWPGSAELDAKWQEFLDQEMSDVIAGGVQRGLSEETVERVTATHSENLAKWKEIIDGLGETPSVEDFAEALWTEVYSKVDL